MPGRLDRPGDTSLCEEWEPLQSELVTVTSDSKPLSSSAERAEVAGEAAARPSLRYPYLWPTWQSTVEYCTE